MVGSAMEMLLPLQDLSVQGELWGADNCAVLEPVFGHHAPQKCVQARHTHCFPLCRQCLTRTNPPWLLSPRRAAGPPALCCLCLTNTCEWLCDISAL